MQKIEPHLAVALAMHSGRGTYALLLGSGVSRSAQIPSGWEIVVALIRRIAALHGEDAGPDSARWFQGRFKVAPEYTALIEMVAPTPAERLQVLRGFFEPGADEDARRPAAAHHAIAKLVVAGYVRVIVTTNFDRLIETAIREAGIEPQVISSEDSARGALPLIHAPCTIIKVHGDYMDTRIKNTAGEVADFPAEVERRLDQVFDEFGVVVCGWSADWDTALRNAILRTPSRRFSLYWAARRPPTGNAEDLVSARRGTYVPVTDADSFFTLLAEQIEAVDRVASPSPISSAIALELMKKYLRDAPPRIRAADLLCSEVDRVLDGLNAQPRSHQQVIELPEGASLILRWEELMETLLRLLAVTAYWTGSDLHHGLVQAIQRLAYRPLESSGVSYPMARELLNFPALLAFYVAGAAAILRNDYMLLRALLQEPRIAGTRSTWARPMDELVIGSALDEYARGVRPALEPGRKWKWPASDHLREKVSGLIVGQEPDASEAVRAVDRFECLLSFAHWVSQGDRPWAPVGSFASARGGDGSLVDDLIREAEAGAENWPPYEAGIFGDADWSAVRAALATFHEHVRRNAHTW